MHMHSLNTLQVLKKINRIQFMLTLEYLQDIYT